MTDAPATLVINGDDLGLDPHSDAALLEAGRRGALTSVSLVVNGASALASARRALGIGLGVGLHLNLTEGRPLVEGLGSLVDDHGRFPGKAEAWRRLAADRVDPDEVAREAAAQWRRLEEVGVRPDHVDSHNHVHLYPPVLEGLRRALGERAVALRVPFEPEAEAAARPGFASPTPDEERFRRLCSGTRWRLPERFAGFGFSARPELSSLSHLRIPRRGLTELMVHPGQRPGSPFTEARARAEEAQLLLLPGTRATLESWGYRLATFAEESAA